MASRLIACGTILLAETREPRNHAATQPVRSPGQVLRFDARQPRARHRQDPGAVDRDRPHLSGNRPPRAPEVDERPPRPAAEPREPGAERGVRLGDVVAGPWQAERGAM